MVLLDTETPGTSGEICSDDAKGSNSLLSCIAQCLEHWVCIPGFASSNFTIGILTVNFSTGTRSFCVQ